MYANMNFGNPGGAYHDAYLLARSGHRKELKSRLKSNKYRFASYQEMAAFLEPLVSNRIVIRDIQYGTQEDRLVQYRYYGNDEIWHAYLSKDGYVLVTNSEWITTVIDAEKSLTSKEVKWQQVKWITSLFL